MTVGVVDFFWCFFTCHVSFLSFTEEYDRVWGELLGDFSSIFCLLSVDVTEGLTELGEGFDVQFEVMVRTGFERAFFFLFLG